MRCIECGKVHDMGRPVYACSSCGNLLEIRMDRAEALKRISKNDIKKRKESGMKTVTFASTGNTSASLSAYAGLAGMRCVVLIPEGKVALGKLAQAMMHGATIVQVKGTLR